VRISINGASVRLLRASSQDIPEKVSQFGNVKNVDLYLISKYRILRGVTCDESSMSR
jgi:hypothetical protein